MVVGQTDPGPRPATAPPVVSETVAELTARARELIGRGSRRVLGVTGAPGAGKSTLCTALASALASDAVVVGMDGFHLANAELARLGRSLRKGAPDTFDVDGYVSLLGRLRQQGADPVYGPVFDRGLEESIGSAVPVFPDTPLVITEGNYLLVDGPGWGAVRACLDEVWYLEVDPAVRGRRLVSRRQSSGHSAAEAQAWVTAVDGPNASVIEATRGNADLVVRVTAPSGARDVDTSPSS